MKKKLVAAAVTVSLVFGGSTVSATAAPLTPVKATPVATVIGLYEIQSFLSIIATLLTIIQVARTLQGDGGGSSTGS